MLAFWPSLSLLVFFLVIFLECRAIAGRVTLPLGGFLMVFCYGAIGAPLLALLLQQIAIFPDAGVDPAAPIAWLIGPPIEELAKAIPVIVLAFLTRDARRLSIADLTLVGFASGAGFGFVEGNLNAIVNGTLPGLQHLAALGLQTGNGAVFFAGHAVATALVGLAAGIGLRFLPLKIAYACAPAALAILWTSFDHGLYNWKLLNAAGTGALPQAHFIVELLHTLTLKGQLATWLMPLGLIAAQFFEAYLCTKAVGARRDLLLAREWRPWVVNEWLVVLLRAPLGRAAFGQTLAYFRLRRAFYLALFEARRDPGDLTWLRHARALEERLKRERFILFDPPPGTWLLPFPVLKTYASEWTWRMRWVLVFAVLLFFLFMLGPRSLPDWLRHFLYGEVFSIAVVTAGLAFATWQIVRFARAPPPDPLAAEGAACAGYHTRALLLGCSFVCGLFPALALLLGWKAFAPGAAFISGYLPGWIGQGGNLQTLLGLGAIGSSVAPDPRPAGEAYRHEIAAGDERIRRLALDIEDTTGVAETALPGSARPLQLGAFLEAMAKLDAERDAQARRQFVLDECERHAGEATVTDPAPAVQAVKDEFDRLASALLDTAAKELDAIASLEQAYGRAWAEIMQDLDAHDVLRRRLKQPLHAAWQAQNDIGWALRVVEAADEGLLPMQLTLLPELHALATSAQSARADMVAAGIARIREAAARYGEEDPFGFAGPDQADDDEAALLAEFVSAAPEAETPKAFGQRAPHPVETPAQADDRPPAAEAEPARPAATSEVRDALDKFIDGGRGDERYLATIRHLERSAESLRQPIVPVEEKPPSSEPVAVEPAEPRDATEMRTHPVEYPPVEPRSERQGEVEDLIDAIKRDSGYLEFARDKQAAQAHDDRVPSEPAESTPEAGDMPAAQIAQTTDDAFDAIEVEAPAAATGEIADEPAVASTPSEPAIESVKRGDTAYEHPPEPVVAAAPDTPAVEVARAKDDTDETFDVKAPTATDEPVVSSAPVEPATEPVEPEATVSAYAPDMAIVREPPADEDARVEPFVLVAPDEAAGDAREPQAAAAPAALDHTDQLALPLTAVSAGNDVAKAETETPSVAPSTDLPRVDDSHAEAREQLRVDERTSHTPSERAEAEKPAAVETRPGAEVTRPREPDPETEIRASLFAGLFQSVRRPSDDSATKPLRWDEKPHEDTAKAVGARPAQSLATQSDEKPSGEITARKADWLADFSAQEADNLATPAGDMPLEPIAWPSPSRPADIDVSARKPDVAATPVEDVQPTEAPAEEGRTQAIVDSAAADLQHIEVVAPVVDAAEHIETQAAGDDSQPVVDSARAMADAGDVRPADVATPAVEIAEPTESEMPVVDAANSPVASQSADVAPAADTWPDVATAAVDEPAEPAAATPVAADSPSTEIPTLEGADEFSSKADRLSYLLAKLEQAVQAKAAAPALPSEVPAAPAAHDAAPAKPEDIAVDTAPQTPASEPPIAVEHTIEESRQPVEHTPQADQPSETPAPVAEAFAAPVEPTSPAEAEPEPELLRTEVTFPAEVPSHPQETTEGQLKPERLSFLLNKLFEAAKRQSAAEPAEPQQIDSTPAPDVVPPHVEEAAQAHPAESEVLDLRGPHPIPKPAEEPDESSVAIAPPLETPTPNVAIVAPEQVQQAPVEPDTTSAEIPEPVASPGEPLETAPEAARVNAAPQPQPIEQPGAPKRAHPAEPATHFGVRRRPPRPGTGARALDAVSKPGAAMRAPEQPGAEGASQLATPQRPAASVEAETPASTPKRDWKLARGEASKPAEAAVVDSVKKPEIRVKTGSGALATTDEALTSSPAVTANTPGKYYGPRLAKDDDSDANTTAQQRALSLADALNEYYAQTSELQPPMHTTDRATLQRIITNGKLEAPRRRGAAWSTSGMARRGEVAIRLKPGADQFIEFVPSREIFGQVPHYYARGVGKGTFATHVPAGYLEYFDVTTRQWVPLLRGPE